MKYLYFNHCIYKQFHTIKPSNVWRRVFLTTHLQNWCDSVFCYISIHPFSIIYQIFTVFNTKIEHDLTKLEIFTYRKLFLIIHARIFYQLSFLRFLFAILYFFSETSGFAHNTLKWVREVCSFYQNVQCTWTFSTQLLGCTDENLFFAFSALFSSTTKCF